MMTWVVVWALCVFVAWAAQRATISRVRATNKAAEDNRKPGEPRVWLMEPIPWPFWLILLPPVTPIAMFTWLIKWGVILWGTTELDLRVDPETQALFYEQVGTSPPPDN